MPPEIKLVSVRMNMIYCIYLLLKELYLYGRADCIDKGNIFFLCAGS